MSRIGCVDILALLLLAPAVVMAAAGAGETANADAQRKKPLQRCDQLKDNAQLECLNKARQRIVEARQKREASGSRTGESSLSAPPSPPVGKQ